MTEIIWTPRLTKLSKLKENPQNPKIITEIGKRRLNKSLSKWGLAGTLVANLNSDLINGHSRKKDMEEAGIEEAWVSFPSRLLTDEEYKEMNAMYDIAVAGDPDQFMMEQTFEDELLQEWDLKKPKGEKGAKALFPIVPKFDEKHDAIIILIETNSESAFIRNALLMEENSSYKNKHVGESFVTTGKKFIKAWNAK